MELPFKDINIFIPWTECTFRFSRKSKNRARWRRSSKNNFEINYKWPLVVIPKDDGTVRLCVVYEVVVNDPLMNINYPIKEKDEVLNSLKDSTYFCKLHLCKAYFHLQTDERVALFKVFQCIKVHASQ